MHLPSIGKHRASAVAAALCGTTVLGVCVSGVMAAGPRSMTLKGETVNRPVELRRLAMQRGTKAVPELLRALKTGDGPTMVMAARWLGRIGPASAREELRHGASRPTQWADVQDMCSIALSLIAARHGGSLEDGMREMGKKWGWGRRSTGVLLRPHPEISDWSTPSQLTAMREAVWVLADAKSSGHNISDALRRVPYENDPQCVLRLQLAGMKRAARIKMLVDRLAKCKVLTDEEYMLMQPLADEGEPAVAACISRLRTLLRRPGRQAACGSKGMIRILEATGNQEALPVLRDATKANDKWVVNNARDAIVTIERGTIYYCDPDW